LWVGIIPNENRSPGRRRIVRYISADNPVAAKRAGRELLLAGDGLAMLPRHGRPGRQAGTRELAVTPLGTVPGQKTTNKRRQLSSLMQLA
jgi:plasmid stabilization system protein ParE